MSLLSYIELCNLVEQGVITAAPANINAASIDVTLDEHILTERSDTPSIVDLSNKENIYTEQITINSKGYLLKPGQFILASSAEQFNLPTDIVAEYVLKSSQARNGLNHLLSGYADPGWYNSKLTLELHNVTKYHHLKIKPGMKIGQIKFYHVTKVPEHASYANTGQYNAQKSVTASKGIR